MTTTQSMARASQPIAAAANWVWDRLGRLLSEKKQRRQLHMATKILPRPVTAAEPRPGASISPRRTGKLPVTLAAGDSATARSAARRCFGGAMRAPLRIRLPASAWFGDSLPGPRQPLRLPSGTLPNPISGFFPISGHPLTRYRVICPDIGVFF